MAGGSGKSASCRGLAYGTTVAAARTKVQALALHVIADRRANGEPVPFDTSNIFAAA
jgi:hypothetical protein